MGFETLHSSGLLLKMRMGMIRSENAFDEESGTNWPLAGLLLLEVDDSAFIEYPSTP